MASSNHKIFFGLNNRGNKIEIELRTYIDQVLPAAQLNDPITAEDAGDGFLERQGYTIVDAGWQGDVAPGNNRLFPGFRSPPSAMEARSLPTCASNTRTGRFPRRGHSLLRSRATPTSGPTRPRT